MTNVNILNNSDNEMSVTNKNGVIDITVNEKINSPDLLPPVGCPLVIIVGDKEIKVQRTKHIKNKYGDMIEYKTEVTGEIILGRFRWRYP